MVPQAYNCPSLVNAKILIVLGTTLTIVFPNKGFAILVEVPTNDCAVNSIGSGWAIAVPFIILLVVPLPHTCNLPLVVNA